MTRLLVLCTRPHHLDRAQADAWFREAVGPLTESQHIERVRLAWLQSVSPRHSRAWDLLLDVELAEGADAAECVSDDACAALLGDLRLLGMRPSLLLIDELEAL